MKPVVIRSLGLSCLYFISLLLLNTNAQLNFLQQNEASPTSQNVSFDKDERISPSLGANLLKLKPFDIKSVSQLPNQEVLQSNSQIQNAVLYKIKTYLNNNDSKIFDFQQIKEVVTRINNENIVLVWENTVPSNTIMLLDVLSNIQFDSGNSFSFTHKCYKKEPNFWSSSLNDGITCVFTIKPKISEDINQDFKSSFRRLQEENKTISGNDNKTLNITGPPKPHSNESKNAGTSNTSSNSTSHNTTKPVVKPPKDASGTHNKPIKTEVASIQPKSSLTSVVLLLAGGLVIAAIIIACIKLRKRWKKNKFFAIKLNRKIDLHKLVIKPSFLHLPESGMVSVNSGVLKGKRSLFLSDTNYGMSPVIDIKTVQQLNLEENHRSSMIPEEVILTNIDDSPESMDSSKTSEDASPQDLGFNIEFSILDAQESSKFRHKNLKSEV